MCTTTNWSAPPQVTALHATKLLVYKHINNALRYRYLNAPIADTVNTKRSAHTSKLVGNPYIFGIF